jgi:PAS domain S-box-containing protein
VSTPKPLKRSLAFTFALSALIPIIALSFLVINYLTDDTIDDINEKNLLLARAVSGQVELFLREPLSALQNISGVLLAFPTMSDFYIQRTLDVHVRNSDLFESVYILDERGKVEYVGLLASRESFRNDFLGIDLSHKAFYQEAKNSGSPQWSGTFLSLMSGKMSLALSIVLGERMLVGNFSIEFLSTFTDNLNVGERVTITIVDRHGSIIVHSDPVKAARQVNISHLPIIKAGLSGNEGTRQYSFEDETYIGSIALIPGPGWAALVSQTTKDAYIHIKQTAMIFAGGAVAAILLSIVFALAKSRQVTTALSGLTSRANIMARGKYDSTLPKQKYTETEELAGSFRDMASAIQKREYQLSVNEQKYRSLIESTKTVPWVMDVSSMGFTYMGQQVEDLLGYSAASWVDFDTWKERLHADDREEIAQCCLEATRQGKDHDLEYRMVTADGDTRWIKDIVSVIKGNGGVSELTGFMIDITERKRSEEALSTSEEKFSKAFRSSPTFITITTLYEGLFIDVNDAFLEASGYMREEVIGHSTQELGMWAVPAARERAVKELLEHEKASSLEVEMRIKSGAILTVLWAAEKIEIEGKPCIIAVALDITERKKLQEQLLHAQKMEAVGQLAGGIAHDFNNILTAIISYSYLIRNKIGKDSPSFNNLEKILLLSDRASQITRGLLTFSRKQHFEFHPINLNDVVSNVEKLISKFIGEDIAVKTRLSGRKPVINADWAQIEQILMNLATNARDAMPDGGTLTIKTELVELDSSFINAHGFGKPGNYAVMTVSDTGVGMNKEATQKIFEPFYTTKEVGKGTGLGLAIIYGIVRQHDGFTHVYSEEGKGTSFKIYFQATHVAPEDRVERELPDVTGKGECILVAEDEESVRESISAILEESKYTVVEACNGEDAVEKFKSHKDEIQLLILDVIMPGLNGKETLEEILKVAPDTKVIFTSGYTADVIRRKKVSEQDVHFVSKPIVPNILLKKIREVLEG